MVYLIAYDLSIENNNESTILDTIHSMGQSNRCLEYSMLLDTECDSAAIYDRIAPLLGPGDRFFVTPVRFKECSGRTAGQYKVWEWFGNHPQ